MSTMRRHCREVGHDDAIGSRWRQMDQHCATENPVGRLHVAGRERRCHWWRRGSLRATRSASIPLSKVRLRLRTARNEPNALVLHEWLKDPTYVLEGLLILQNIAAFAFSAAVTGFAVGLWLREFMQGLISIAIVTPFGAGVCRHHAPRICSIPMPTGGRIRLVPALQADVRADHGGAAAAAGEFSEPVSVRVVGGQEDGG